MACCAAAIFLICQFVYGVQKLVAFVSRGRWGSERMVVADAASAWRSNPDGITPTSVGVPARFTISRRRMMAFAGAPALAIAIAIAIFVLTKPGIPSRIPQSQLLALLHAKICGDPAAFTDIGGRTPPNPALVAIRQRPTLLAPSRLSSVS